MKSDDCASDVICSMKMCLHILKMELQKLKDGVVETVEMG